MKFIDSIDEGAPEYSVSGVARVKRISPNMVRVTYFRHRKGENIETIHAVWDITEWRRNCEMIHRACEGILVERPPGRDDQPSELVH
jgi:hypothetical protein